MTETAKTASAAKDASGGKTASAQADALIERMKTTLVERRLAGPENPVLLMVSGGSDSTTLAYLAAELRDAGAIGPVAMLHVNHQLRGQDADDDARFVAQLAELLDIPLFACEIDIAGEARRSGENVEALARRERYLAANEALASLCLHEGFPLADGRVATAHTADDRIENFYMRSIVGTGPGGFRSMLYRNGPVVRPLLDVGREELRDYLRQREASGAPVVCDAAGELWREDATNAHTDRFRAFVRHEIVPRAKERNPQLTEVLPRTMNLIADEDDMLEAMVDGLEHALVKWVDAEQAAEQEGATDTSAQAPDTSGTSAPLDSAAGCVIASGLGEEPLPLRRRLVHRLLQKMLGQDARIETASVEAVLAAWKSDAAQDRPLGGYVANIQGDLAVSANKHGVRIEPMVAFRARRKRV